MLPDRCHDTTNMTCDNYIFFSRDVFSNGGKKSTCLKIEVTGQILNIV